MRRRIPGPALLPTLAAVAIASVFLQGYTTTGHKWSGTTVPYYINPQSIYVSASAAISAIQTGAAVWSEQSRANIRLVYSGTTNGSSLVMNNKNEVFFRNGSNGSNVAETYWWWDGSGRLVDADMVMYEGAYQFFTVAGCTGGIYVENVTAHEFGHALGLDHSSVPGATMQPSMPSYCDRTQLTLEADDISGIESLYPPTGNPPPNTAPSVTINSPANLSTVAANTSITFSGSASDTQDGNVSSSLLWTSNLLGQIGTGGSFSRTLPAGTHVITATVTDSGGLLGTQQITLTVTAAAVNNTPPSVSILSPASGLSYPGGVGLTFSASATDAQDGNISSNVVWVSSLSGSLGTGASVVRVLPAGIHVVSATVTDNGGMTSSQQVSLLITETIPVNTPPAVTVLSPLAAGSYTDATSITFSGSAIDVPDGDVSSRLVWTSNVSGVIGTGAAFTRTLAAGTHTITASAADNNNQSGFGQVTITVAASQSPPAPPPPPSSISLSARGYKVRGNQQADLTWSGATGSVVDVYRDGSRIATPANTGAWTDAINRKGSASYTYMVCNSGTSTCSSNVTITF